MWKYFALLLAGQRKRYSKLKWFWVTESSATKEALFRAPVKDSKTDMMKRKRSQNCNRRFINESGDLIFISLGQMQLINCTKNYFGYFKNGKLNNITKGSDNVKGLQYRANMEETNTITNDVRSNAENKMDGWTAGRLDGWTAGWLDGWTDGWTGWVDRGMDGPVGWMDGWMDGWKERETDGTDGWMDEWMDLRKGG
ncbi:hypothetical protein CEXT_710701 [Caerostris extrusa]|uniref:Uncharacterized protein n=1 Tax=Caerostris extrusa TaxID=172846 RepID=A0AAV4PIT3_CAEEX|nr:hypothetical protein CEXT_710701 [Caerostris extrusa]